MARLKHLAVAAIKRATPSALGISALAGGALGAGAGLLSPLPDDASTLQRIALTGATTAAGAGAGLGLAALSMRGRKPLAPPALSPPAPLASAGPHNTAYPATAALQEAIFRRGQFPHPDGHEAPTYSGELAPPQGIFPDVLAGTAPRLTEAIHPGVDVPVGHPTQVLKGYRALLISDPSLEEEIRTEMRVTPEAWPAVLDAIKKAAQHPAYAALKLARWNGKPVLMAGGGALQRFNTGQGHVTAGAGLMSLLRAHPHIGLLGVHDNDPTKHILLQPRLLDDYRQTPLVEHPHPNVSPDLAISAGYMGTTGEAASHFGLTGSQVEAIRAHKWPPVDVDTLRYYPEALHISPSRLEAARGIAWGPRAQNHKLFASTPDYPVLGDATLANASAARARSLPDTLKSFHKTLTAAGDPAAGYIKSVIEDGERTGVYKKPIFLGGGGRGDYGAIRARNLYNSPQWRELQKTHFLLPHLGSERAITSRILPPGVPGFGNIPQETYLGLQWKGLTSGNPTAQSAPEARLGQNNSHFPSADSLRSLKAQQLELLKADGRLSSAEEKALQTVDIPSWNGETLKLMQQGNMPGVHMTDFSKFPEMALDPAFATRPGADESAALATEHFRNMRKSLADQIYNKVVQLT